MRLGAFLILAVGVYALLEFKWLPQVHRRLTMDRTMATIAQGGLYACLGFLRSVALMAGLSTLFLMVTIWVLTTPAPYELPTIERLQAAIWTARKWLLAFGQMWGWGV